MTTTPSEAYRNQASPAKPLPPATEAPRPLVACAGTQDESIRWLRQQIGTFAELSPLAAASMEIEELDDFLVAASHQGVQRIVLSFTCRLAATNVIKNLHRLNSEIPIAIALGQWFDGSRRTGHGDAPLLQMAWHRYWDGWHRWIHSPGKGLLATPIAPPQHLLPRRKSLATPLRPGSENSLIQPVAYVVTDLRETYLAWDRQFASLGAASVHWTTRKLREALRAGSLPADFHAESCAAFLVTDGDRGLNRVPAIDRTDDFQAGKQNGITELLQGIRHLASQPLVYSCMIPRADQWQRLGCISEFYPLSALSTSVGLQAILRAASHGTLGS